MGPWSFIQPLIIKLLRDSGVNNKSLEYIGRKESASTATGLFKKTPSRARANYRKIIK